jgi:hypothetical protein
MVRDEVLVDVVVLDVDCEPVLLLVLDPLVVGLPVLARVLVDVTVLEGVPLLVEVLVIVCDGV